LPGDLAGFGNRPGGYRPNRPGRPGIGGNRPGIGDGNAIWNNGNFNSGNFNNNFNNNNFNNVHVGGGYGGWGYPGGGYGGWGYGGGYGGGSGWVNPHYGNWYNGGWNGNWGGYNGGWWAPFAAGAATWGLLSSVGNWGLGYGTLGYGAAGYVNPYYSAVPAAVVAASPYDYSQPVFVDSSYASGQAAPVVEGTQPADDSQATAQASPTDVAVDEALAKFKAGDYAGALAGFDKALRLSPKDSVIHEVRALALFALGRYPEAAATLNSVLASAPGMDWTTVSNVYGSVDAYTGHLRKLEDFCRTHPDDAAAHFVLGYQYLVGGSSDMAAAALRVVIAKQPGDVVAKRLLDAIAPAAQDQAQPAPTAESAPQGATARPAAEQALPEIDLVGTWKATSGKDTIQLTVTADSKFTWKAQPDGKPPVTLDGSIETTADAVALVSKSAGTMVAKVTPKTADSFEFSLAAAPKDTPPLVFSRQP
jgi:Tfp pilus assembly protein PilF